MENRLNATVNNLSNVVTNTQASRSRIQDTDYASETTALAKAQIISQAATAMLAQANQQPQSVLSLLK
jgi:flagellin